jgi:uncharacterized protein with von Willebrand factor type A (vWA) domain
MILQPHHVSEVFSGELPRPSAAGLPANIVRFGRYLRSQGLPVSAAEIMDALQSVTHIDIGRKALFFNALRCNLVSRREHLALFEKLFKAYWLSPESDFPASGRGPGEGHSDEADRAPFQRETFAERATAGQGKGRQDVGTLSYSRRAGERHQEYAGISYEASQPIYNAMAELLEPLQRMLSRRFQYSPHGAKVNLRRLLRKNIQYGGEPLVLDFKSRKTRRRRVVVFCDVSGSMDFYTLMTFQFVHALMRIAPQTEIFFFSTDLTRMTPSFQVVDFAAALTGLPGMVNDWGGGTRIGHCLKAFTATYGRRWLTRRTIVMLFSDGWDRGETELLQQQLALIKKRVFKVLWFNPLIGTKDYQPICRGMRAALPYIDYFLASRRLYDFKTIGQVLERIMT